MEKFNKAFEYIMRHEGGYINHPNDPGGETKYGISKRSYPHVDIKSLTKDQAKGIYLVDFWSIGKFEDIQDANIAIKLFDLTVNMGAKQANKIIQRALRCIGFEDIKEDGIIGKISLNAINCTDPDLLMIALKSEAAGFYQSLNKPKFIAGWLNRAYSNVH